MYVSADIIMIIELDCSDTVTEKCSTREVGLTVLEFSEHSVHIL